MFPIGPDARRRLIKYGLPLFLLALLSTAVPLAVPRDGRGIRKKHRLPRKEQRKHLNLRLPELEPTASAKHKKFHFAKPPMVGKNGRKMPSGSISPKSGLEDVRPFMDVLYPHRGRFGRGDLSSRSRKGRHGQGYGQGGGQEQGHPGGEEPVPEPATVMLVLVAGGAVAVRRLRRRHRTT